MLSTIFGIELLILCRYSVQKLLTR